MFEFPIVLFYNSVDPTNPTIRTRDDLAMHILTLTSSHHPIDHMAFLKARYQLKASYLLERALQKQDTQTIRKWYLPGLYRDSSLFSPDQIAFMEKHCLSDLEWTNIWLDGEGYLA